MMTPTTTMMVKMTMMIITSPDSAHFLTNHGEQVRVVDRSFLGVVYRPPAPQHASDRQPEVRAERVDDQRTSGVGILQEFNSNQFVDGVEYDLQETNNQELQPTDFPQDSPVRDEHTTRRELRPYQAVEGENPLKVTGELCFTSRGGNRLSTVRRVISI